MNEYIELLKEPDQDKQVESFMQTYNFWIKYHFLRLFKNNDELFLLHTSPLSLFEIMIELIFGHNQQDFVQIIKRNEFKNVIQICNDKILKKNITVCKFCWLFYLNVLYKKKNIKMKLMYVLCSLYTLYILYILLCWLFYYEINVCTL